MASEVPRSPATVDIALDNLVRLVEVIGSDRELRTWFTALANLSEVERRNAIFSLSEKLRSDGDDADLISSFRFMADPRIFSAARLALTESDRGSLRR